MSKEALKRISDKLKKAGAILPFPQATGTVEGSMITGLCIALAIVEQEIEELAEQPAPPVAWPCLIAEADFSENTVTLAMQCTDYKVSAGKHWLYTSPQPTWVGLTTKEIREWWASENGLEDCGMAKVDDFEQVVRAIEAKLKEKNT